MYISAVILELVGCGNQSILAILRICPETLLLFLIYWQVEPGLTFDWMGSNEASSLQLDLCETSQLGLGLVWFSVLVHC